MSARLLNTCPSGMCITVSNRARLRRSRSAHAHHAHAARTDVVRKIACQVFDCAKCSADRCGSCSMRTCKAAVANRMTPERCSIICRAAVRAVMNSTSPVGPGAP